MDQFNKHAMIYVFNNFILKCVKKIIFFYIFVFYIKLYFFIFCILYKNILNILI